MKIQIKRYNTDYTLDFKFQGKGHINYKTVWQYWIQYKALGKSPRDPEGAFQLTVSEDFLRTNISPELDQAYIEKCLASAFEMNARGEMHVFGKTLEELLLQAKEATSPVR
ncbi:MAG TPA: hypothetical protein VJP80_03310 [Candidatus Saccharimonadales bacterium]|nr:hypothetical protein [Candidatus Saccharimonadales bacterium]